MKQTNFCSYVHPHEFHEFKNVEGHTDPFMTQLQDFYSQLGDVAREVVLVSGQFYSWYNPQSMDTLYLRLLQRKDLKVLRESYEVKNRNSITHTNTAMSGTRSTRFYFCS